MAETSGFFPDVSGDRSYTSDWLAAYIASIIGNGVYNGDLAVTAAGSAMSITLPAGRAWINGYHYRNGGNMTLAIDNADGVLNRIDIVVLRWDVNERSITAQVIKGTPASTATSPAIVRSVEQYDLKLAEISIPAGTTAITQALITDTRLDNAVCGIVTGVVDQVPTDTLYAQIQDDLTRFRATNEADFTAWMQSLKDVLDGDTAGNLLNLINAVSASAVPSTRTVNGHALSANVTVTAADVGAATISTVSAATLPTSGWTGDTAPYSITVSVAAAKSEPTRIEVQPIASATAAQWATWRAALIRGGGQGAGAITLLADGDKPEIDIPITITVRGDVQ